LLFFDGPENDLLFFDRITENGRCYFSTGEMKMADAVFSTGELKMADAIYRQEK